MIPTLQFPVRRVALLVAAIYAPAALAAQAGRVDFTTGEPVLVGSDGRERPVHKGDQIGVGDRILTRAGRAQVAFADGGYVSLQPNTEFGVEEYSFNGRNDGSEKSVFSLLKGALRTVTGIIGRRNRDAYTMRTPTATIGIRGTGGLMEVNDTGTLVRGTSGTWFLRTQGGSIDIPAGSSGFAGQNTSQPPQLTSTAPSTPPASAGGSAPQLGTYSSTEQVNSSGNSGVVNIVVPSAPTGMTDGSGYAVSYAWSASSPTMNSSTTATFNGGVQLTSWNGSSNVLGSGTVVDFGNDGLIGWGRWTGSLASLEGSPNSFAANQGVHYVVGIPTATMPTTGTATYTLLGATTPTWLTGGTGTLSAATVSVDFATAMLSYALAVTMSGQTYTISNSGVPATSIFSDTPTVTGAPCVCGCSGSVQGIFTGSAAERLGMTYLVDDFGQAKKFVGAVAFQKQ